MIFIIVDFTNCTVSIILWNNHSGPCAYVAVKLTCIDMGATSILVTLLVTLLVTGNPGLENLGVVDRYESWMSVDVKV